MDKETNWPAVSAHARENAREAIEELSKLLSRFDPIEIVSRVAAYIIPSDPDGPTDAGGIDKSESHLDYLISFVTAHPFPESAEFPGPDVIQETLELVTKIHVAASNHHLSRAHRSVDGLTSVPEIADQFSIDRLHVRGEAYWPHLRHMLTSLLSPHDIKFRKSLGFTSDDFFKFMERMEDEIQFRFTKEEQTHIHPFIELLRPWRHEMSKQREDEGVYSEEFREFLSCHGETLAAAKIKFDQFGTPSLFAIKPTTMQEESILASLSCEIGDNLQFRGKRQEHSFWPLTDSLADRKPIIRHDGVYYAFNPLKILRGAFGLMGELLREADPLYWEQKFLKSRDAYLEKETALLFRKALPTAQITSTADYDVLSEGKVAEVDHVVACDDFLLIIECKAGSITSATKRGADQSTKTDINKTIANGLSQAQRLVNELTERGSIVLRPQLGGPEVHLAAKSFRWIAKINVTLELITPVATQLWVLDESGLLGDTGQCWSVALNDLRVVVDILDTPALFLHYLIQRIEMNEIRSVTANDELDYLMRYVKNGLFFREANQPKERETLMLLGYTEDLDQYYRRVQGVTNRGKKPRVALGNRTKRMLELLQDAQPLHWVSGCLQLLEFDIPVREELLAKLVNQLALLKETGAVYGFSVITNTRLGRGLALASSRNVMPALELVKARCVDCCKKYSLNDVWVIMLGVPVSFSPISVFLVSADDVISDTTRALLRQVSINHKEHRASHRTTPGLILPPR